MTVDTLPSPHPEPMLRPKLWTKNFMLACWAAFMMFFAFYMLLPIIATYVVEMFGVSARVSGIVVSCYIITALLVRPVSGYLVDKYDRKKLYLLAYLLFTALFFGYIAASSIFLLLIIRILLGGTFSVVTTAGSTLTIDIIPSARRGEGIGFAGAITNLAMATGPMTGIYLSEIMSYPAVFTVAASSCAVGVAIASFIQAPIRKPVIREPLSLDRFFLVKGLAVALVTALLAFPYGTIMTYIPLYAKELGMQMNVGGFFVLFSIGIIVSRSMSGKMLNAGIVRKPLNTGITCVCAGLFLLVAFFDFSVMYYVIPLLLGLGFGFTQPTLQTMMIALAPHRQRGTANSTFFISLDFGSGIGMFAGGFIASAFDYQAVYLAGTVGALLALLLFNGFVFKKYTTLAETVKE